MSPLVSPLLSIISILGLGFSAALLTPASDVANVRKLCLATSLAALLIGVLSCLSFDKAAVGYQFMSSFNFVPEYNLSFAIGVDGLSLVFLLLTLATFPALFLSA